MHVIRARNVNDAYASGYNLLQNLGQTRTTRNGTALVAPEPVTTHYNRPTERVIFHVTRDANPVFHFMEALWILAGRRDVAFLEQFNSNIARYSDDRRGFHAAYGHRLRHWASVGTHRIDQLDALVQHLTAHPDSRRAVASIWDPTFDLGARSLDIPCNDMLKFELRDDRLNLVVFNRSNDIVWGCYGANVVQFSTIQEYLAGRLGVGVGWYEQVSCDFHAYPDVFQKHAPDPFWHDPYLQNLVQPFPLVARGDQFDRDLAHWMNRDLRHQYGNPVFPLVAEPMYKAWKAYKNGELAQAQELAKGIAAEDWKLATVEWLERRAARRLTKQQPKEQSA